MKELKPMFAICCFFMLFATPSYAEDYSSKTFPPESVIAKAINQLKLTYPPSQKFIKSVGKYQDKDGLYHYYYTATSPHFNGQRILKIRLAKLDTDIWLIVEGPGGIALEK